MLSCTKLLKQTPKQSPSQSPQALNVLSFMHVSGSTDIQGVTRVHGAGLGIERPGGVRFWQSPCPLQWLQGAPSVMNSVSIYRTFLFTEGLWIALVVHSAY